MKFLGQDIEFWIVVFVAAMLKIRFSSHKSMWDALFSLVAAIFTPWLFTEAILDWADWPREPYLLPTAGLLAWSGTQVVKFFSNVSLHDLIKLVRGGTK